MTPPHPDAVGTYGPDAIAWGERRKIHERRTEGVRWWQRLALHRALEHDREGNLVWPVVIITGPRQAGKSWIERIVCGWRMDQVERFGEVQHILHVAHKLTAAKEVWLPAARYYESLGRRQAAVRYANDAPGITLATGSRWLLQAATEGAGVSFALSMALLDETWRIPRTVYEGGIEPTMAEAVSPQTWLVSTAGTSDSDLMIAYRSVAIAVIERGSVRPGDPLLIEYSAPTDRELAEAGLPPLDLDDPKAWRAAQAHWDKRREGWLRRKRKDADELAFRQQGLNQWIPSMSPPALGADAWARLRTEGAPSGRVSFGAEVAPDHSYAVVVSLGRGVAELVEELDHGLVAPRLAQLAERHGGPVGLDGSGPAAAAADSLKAPLGERLVRMTAAQTAAASGQLYDALAAARPAMLLREHRTFQAAVAGARRRKSGKVQVWDPDRAGMVMKALSAALWAEEHSAPEPEPEEPRIFL
jgi:hypothetical protein